MLDKRVKVQLRKLVLRHKKGLESQLSSLSKNERTNLKNEAGRSTSGNHIADNPRQPNINLALIPNLQKQIKKCDEALQRIQNGTYGYCKDCEEPIPLGRLMNIPFADRCVSCKEDAEKKDLIPNASHTRFNRPTVVMT